MREFIEDALDHRDDGYGRAQRAMREQQLPRRFYKDVAVAAVEGGHGVTLDGRQARTPGNRTPLVVPDRGLAESLAAEWAAQGEFVNPAIMPLTRLVNAALESGEARVPEFCAEVVRFVGNDLLLYRADSPRELVAEQERLWDDALVRVARRFGVAFQPTVGIIHQSQPEATLLKLGAALEGEGLLAATALVSITSLLGSGILAIGLRHELIGADEAWTMAHVDEDHQARLWGIDAEAAARREKRRAEFDAAMRVLEAVNAP